MLFRVRGKVAGPRVCMLEKKEGVGSQECEMVVVWGREAGRGGSSIGRGRLQVSFQTFGGSPSLPNVAHPAPRAP